MEILIVTHSVSRLAGGLFESVRKPLILLVKEKGLKVDVLGVQDEYSTTDIDQWKPIVPHTFIPLGPRQFGYSSLVDQYLTDRKPQIIHMHGVWSYSDIACRNYCFTNKVPYLISPRGMLDSWALKNSEWKKKIAGLLYEKKNLKGANCLHALNREEKIAIRNYGLEKPVCIIPNGIEVFDFASRRSPPWPSYILSAKKVILFLGRIHPKKGLRFLLQAWKKLITSGCKIDKTWSLVIAGWNQNNHEEELKRVCRDLSIDKSVHFIGPVFGEEKTAVFQNADAFILPSLSEGLPMTILEAWSYGVPVLMTPECNLHMGFTTHAAIEIHSNVDSIACGLEKLTTMKDSELKDMGGKGRDLVRAAFTWEKIAADLYSVYSWILGGGVPPPCVEFD